MSKYKAVIDYSPYPAAELAPIAQAILDGFVAAPAIFINPPQPLPDLQAAITDFLDKLAAKATRAIAATIAFNISRHELEVLLAEFAAYANTVAEGNPTVIVASRCPFYDTAHTPPDNAPPAAPTNLVLRHGDLSGSVLARYHPARARSVNEVQTCTGDPNTEANWQHAGMFSGGKAPLAGLTPATTVWVRVRTAGLKGVMGAWSDPAKIIVT